MYSNNDWRYYAVDEPLQHHGIMGQKWGVRRFQNSDGSLTSAGKKRYGGVNNGAGSSVAKAVGGTLGFAVGAAGAAAFTLVSGFIAPYLQLGFVAATTTAGTKLAERVIDKYSDVPMDEFRGRR